MKQIPLYYRNDLEDDIKSFKYCPGFPKKYLTSEYFTVQEDPTAFFGLFGDPFDIIFKDKDNTDENYYFPLIPSLSQIDSKIDEFNIPDDVHQDIINKQCKILVFNSYEGWEWSWWKKLVYPLQIKYNLSLDDFVFVCANSHDAPDLRTVYNSFWERQTKHEDLTWLNDRGNKHISDKAARENKFICLNRRPHAGRFAGVTALYPYIDNGCLSMGMSGQMYDGYFEEQQGIFEVGYPEHYVKYKELDIRNKLPITIDDKVDAERQNPVHDWSIDKFYNSFLHICPETYQYYRLGRTFFSEKIFKPMMYFQPFVILGEPGALKALQDMGYRTFSDILDESYDNIQHNEERMTAALNSAIAFFDRPNEELHAVMSSITNTLTHNISMLSYRANMMDSNLKEELRKHLNG